MSATQNAATPFIAAVIAAGGNPEDDMFLDTLRSHQQFAEGWVDGVEDDLMGITSITVASGDTFQVSESADIASLVSDARNGANYFASTYDSEGNQPAFHPVSEHGIAYLIGYVAGVLAYAIDWPSPEVKLAEDCGGDTSLKYNADGSIRTA